MNKKHCVVSLATTALTPMKELKEEDDVVEKMQRNEVELSSAPKNLYDRQNQAIKSVRFAFKVMFARLLHAVLQYGEDNFQAV